MNTGRVPLEVVVRVEGVEQVKEAIAGAQSAAWLEGMNHVLSWLALRQFSETLAKDNPHGRVEPSATGFPPRPLRKDKVG